MPAGPARPRFFSTPPLPRTINNLKNRMLEFDDVDGLLAFVHRINHSDPLLYSTALVHLRKLCGDPDKIQYAKSHPLFAPLLLRISQAIPDLRPRELSNILHTLARLDCLEFTPEPDSAPLVTQLVERLFIVADGLNSVELAATIHAFALGYIHDPPTFRLLAACMLDADILKALDAQGISTVLWSFATLNHYEPLLIKALAQRASTRLQDFSLLGLDNIFFALGRFLFHHEELFTALVPELLRRHKERPLSPSFALNALLALSKAKFFSEPLFVLLREIIVAAPSDLMAHPVDVHKLVVLGSELQSHPQLALPQSIRDQAEKAKAAREAS